MMQQKLAAGASFPDLIVPNEQGQEHNISRFESSGDWRIVVVYRGVHCPICTKYLTKLEAEREALAQVGVDIVAVTADNNEQLKKHLSQMELNFPVYGGLSIEQMEALGLYISEPRSEKETDHPFPEPGLFVIDQQQVLRLIDIANNPIIRPEIETLVRGLAFIKDPENNYPIRGRFSRSA